MTVFLSVVIPAYNEEARIGVALEKVRAYLEHQPYSSEVIVVENGSTDRTAAIVETAAAQPGVPVRLLRLDRAGKGRAVRAGMLAAVGEYRFFADADLSMPIEQLARFLPPAIGAADLAIGSREAPGARRIGEPAYRHIMGRVYNLIIRLVAVNGFDDTQCGFKMFRGEAADWLFRHQLIDGWAFDIELLLLAKRRGYRIVEVPIDWYHGEQSKVRPVRDTVTMLGETLKIRLNVLRGRYPAREQSTSPGAQ
ncbi:MAG: glycosyltransferase family 2 protein [Chloroflexota bacterium]|nr:glycosyltransferase family 2 protein [Dehalococcoidia bacterium]MDW8252392.1 glycosyltransferase family 2 protein [Chloroflexota bacterium]